MHPAELAILLHRALEVRLARLQDLLGKELWSEDIEQLHQVRVAARRLSAVLDLVDAEIYPGHKGHRRALKRLVDILGLTRELDVHAEHLHIYHQDARTPAQAAVIEHLMEYVDRKRAKVRRAMGRQLERLRLPDLHRLLAVPLLRDPFQSTSLQQATWGCLEPRAEGAMGNLADLVAHEDPVAMHRTRVKIKKLRYAIEALEGAFAERPDSLLGDLRALQTALGDHHDLAILEAMLWELEGQFRLRNRPNLCGGVIELLGDVAETRRAAFDHFVNLARVQDHGAFLLAVRSALGLSQADGPSA
jgi:CHAD domain-containing protein